MHCSIVMLPNALSQSLNAMQAAHCTELCGQHELLEGSLTLRLFVGLLVSFDTIVDQHGQAVRSYAAWCRCGAQ